MPVDIEKRYDEKTTIEFHFQEIFRGERIDIMTGDKVRVQVVAKTQFQTGLAHIEMLELYDGEEVLLLIEESNIKATVKVDVTKPFLTVILRDGMLLVENTATSPGYL